MRGMYLDRDQRINIISSGYMTSFLQRGMITTIMDFTYIWDRRISFLREEDSYRLTYLHGLVVGGGDCGRKREMVCRKRESKRGCYKKRVCLLKYCKMLTDMADFA